MKKHKQTTAVPELYSRVVKLSHAALATFRRDRIPLESKQIIRCTRPRPEDNHFAQVNCILSGTDAVQVRALADKDMDMWIECCRASWPDVFYKDMLVFIAQYLTPTFEIYRFVFSYIFRHNEGKALCIGCTDNSVILNWCRRAIPDALAKPVIINPKYIVPILRKNAKLFSDKKNNADRAVSLITAAIMHPGSVAGYVECFKDQKWEKVSQSVREEAVHALLQPAHYERRRVEYYFMHDRKYDRATIVWVLRILSKLDLYVDVLSAVSDAVREHFIYVSRSCLNNDICLASPWAVARCIRPLLDSVPNQQQPVDALQRWNRWIPINNHPAVNYERAYRNHNIKCAEKQTHAVLAATSLDKDSISIVIAYSVYIG